MHETAFPITDLCLPFTLFTYIADAHMYNSHLTFIRKFPWGKTLYFKVVLQGKTLYGNTVHFIPENSEGENGIKELIEMCWYQQILVHD